MRGASHRGRRRHAVSLRRQRLPLPHHARRVRGAPRLAVRVRAATLAHSQRGSFVRPCDRPGAPPPPAHFSLRDGVAVRRPTRRAGHGDGPARDCGRRGHAAHPVPEIGGRLRLRQRAGPRCDRPADRRRRGPGDQVRGRSRRPTPRRVPRRPAAPRRSIARHQRHGRAAGRRPLAGFQAGRNDDGLRLHCAPRSAAGCSRRAGISNWTEAEALRADFMPLEDIRDAWGPARVLHHATELSGIAPAGPIPPLYRRWRRGARGSSRRSRARCGSSTRDPRRDVSRRSCGATAGSGATTCARSVTDPARSRPDSAPTTSPASRSSPSSTRGATPIRATRTSASARRKSSAASGRRAGSRWRSPS